MLLKIIFQDIPSIILKSSRNKHSNAIEKIILDILKFLFSTYENNSDKNLLTEEKNLHSKAFDITNPMIIMYNKVEDLEELEEATKNPFTEVQTLKLGIWLIKIQKN